MVDPSPLLQGQDDHVRRTANIRKAWHKLVAEREDHHGHDDDDDEANVLPQYIEADAFADHYLASSQALTSSSGQHTPNSADALPFSPLRSIHYALTLGVLPQQSTVHGWIQAAQKNRAEYTRVRADAYRAPDGTLPDELADSPHFEASSSSHDSPAHTSTHRDWSQNNPLSPDTDAWTAHFEKRQLQKTIMSDVIRCFPDLALLRQEHIQKALSRILFAWAVLHPTIGYRQGMHELAGALLVSRLADAVSCSHTNTQSPTPSALQTLLDEKYIEHDTYAVFDKLMDQLAELYEWQDHASIAAWKPPIIQRSNRIFGHLKYVDPALSVHLTSTMSIEPQLFLLRWLRLLFLREFPLTHALELWDSLFAAAIKGNIPILDLVDWTCIAHLLRLRNRLLVDSQTLVLQTLLHPVVDASAMDQGSSSPSAYSSTSTSSRSIPPQAPGSPPHHTPLLTLQARQLHSAPAPSPQFGVQCVMQNATLLRIPIKAPNPRDDDQLPDEQQQDSTESDLTPPHSRAQAHTTGYGRRPRGRVQQIPAVSLSPTTPPVTAGSLSDFARNLYIRSGADEMLAHASASASASASTRARNHQQPLSPSSLSGGESSNASDLIKWVGAWTSGINPRATPPPPHSVDSSSSGFPDRLSELERDRREARLAPAGTTAPSSATAPAAPTPIDTLRSQNQRLGVALQDVVMTFERHWLNESDAGVHAHPDDERAKSEVHALRALTALKHVRDLLLQGGGEFEEGVVDAFASPSPTPPTSSAAQAQPQAQGQDKDDAVVSSGAPVTRLTRTRTHISPSDSQGRSAAPAGSVGSGGGDRHPVQPVQQHLPSPPPPHQEQQRSAATATTAAAAASDPLGVL